MQHHDVSLAAISTGLKHAASKTPPPAVGQYLTGNERS